MPVCMAEHPKGPRFEIWKEVTLPGLLLLLAFTHTSITSIITETLAAVLLSLDALLCNPGSFGSGKTGKSQGKSETRFPVTRK